MKVRVFIALGLFAAALLSCQVISTQTASGRPRPVKIDEHSVLIPGTTISEADRAAVSDIFKKYDSSLYRVAVYEKGSLKKHLGKMSDIEIGEIASEYSSDAKAKGLTNWTMKIGRGNHITTAGGTTHITKAENTTHVTTGGSPSHITTAENPDDGAKVGLTKHITTIAQQSDALVKEVTPILEKYSR